MAAYKSKWNGKANDRTIDGPMVRDAGKYGILCCIPYGRNNAEFSFGLTKAKAIVKYYKFIEKFVNESGQTKWIDFEENPEIAKMVEDRKQALLDSEDDAGAYVRRILKAHESTENYSKFREGAEV